MNGVGHHGVVDDDKAQALIVAQNDRLGVVEHDAVHRPHVARHIAGKVDCQLSLRVAWVAGGVKAEQVTVAQNLSAIALGVLA